MVSQFSPGADLLLERIIDVLNTTEASPEEQCVTLWALLTTFYDNITRLNGKDNAYQNFYKNQETLGSLIRTNFDRQLVETISDQVAKEEQKNKENN